MLFVALLPSSLEWLWGQPNATQTFLFNHINLLSSFKCDVEHHKVLFCDFEQLQRQNPNHISTPNKTEDQKHQNTLLHNTTSLKQTARLVKLRTLLEQSKVHGTELNCVFESKTSFKVQSMMRSQNTKTRSICEHHIPQTNSNRLETTNSAGAKQLCSMGLSSIAFSNPKLPSRYNP